MKSLSELVKCAKRELAMRQNAYPKWVAAGRMRGDVAQHEIECMTQIVSLLEQQQQPDLLNNNSR